MTLNDILLRFTEGEARIAAAGVLFLAIFVFERVPFVSAWINVDGWKAGEDRADAWLTAQRKKLGANLLIAWAPAGVLLESGAPWTEVVATAVTASLGGHLLNSMSKVALKGSATAVLLVALAATPALTSCSAIASALRHAGPFLNWITQAVDEIERRGPKDDARLAEAINVTRRALRAYGAMSSAADAGEAGDAEVTKRELLAAYEELYAIASQLGLLDDVLGAGEGAVSGAVPTPDEVGARL